MDNGLEKIKRKAVDIFSEEELEQKLKSGRKLTSRPIKTRLTFRSYSCVKSVKDISRNGA